jgi:hypothetical protein
MMLNYFLIFIHLESVIKFGDTCNINSILYPKYPTYSDSEIIDSWSNDQNHEIEMQFP